MKNLFFLLTMFCALTIDAQTFVTVDNVRYLIEDDHAVVARQDRELTGDIIIPASIEYNEVIYNVTRLMSPSDSESGGGGAFQECEITGITLPVAITEIPDQTFYGCRQLSSVTLNGVVTSIGRQAFMLCEALSTIGLTDAVTEIGEQAFREAGLTEFTIPAGVTELKFQVLSETKIAYLEIPATVTTLCDECLAYRYNKNYKTYGPEWPSKRTIKINSRDCRTTSANINTFGDMTIVDLLVPAGSKAVYQEYLPWMRMNSITEFGEETGEPIVPDQRHVTIDGICYLLKNGEAQVAIQPETLSGEVVIPEQVTYEDVDYPVTAVMEAEWDVISYMWFKPRNILSQTAVTKITLPSSIKTIGSESFRGSPSLQEVVLNEGLTDMGRLAFSGCNELTTINIPSSVTILPNAVFWGCHKLTTISLHEGITSLEDEALWDTGLETLTIPSKCTNISFRTLAIPNLKTLVMKVNEPADIRVYHVEPMNCTVFGFEDQEGVREYLSNVDLIVPLGCAESYSVMTPWFYCRSITEEGDEYYQPKTPGVNIDGINYVLHETVNEQEEIVRTATIACQYPSLSGDIVIPETVSYAKKELQDDEWVTLEPQDYEVTDIVSPGFQCHEAPAIFRPVGGAFQECAVTSICLPATITTIPPGTFCGCPQLKSVTLAEGITTIGAGAFANCASLEDIYLPETITDMSEWYIFGNCPSLKKVNIPKLVTVLGDGCFARSGIETFIIPKNVTNIGPWCFGWEKNDNLKSIKICHNSYTDGSISFPEDMFNDVSGITLIVPEGTKEPLYSQIYPWKNFGNIIEYEDQDDEHQYNAYSVSYEEEVIGHEEEASDDTTILDYIPSGVDPSLPEETEKEDYVLIDWHDKLGNKPCAIMPAQDILLRLTLALLGDANGDGDVDVSDFLSVANCILGRQPVGFLRKAANTSKNDNEIDVADFLGVANVILRGVHYGNPHHAKALRKLFNTDISTMDNAIYIEPTSVCVGLEQTLSVKMKNADPVAGFEFILQLPEGFTVTGASLSNERTTSAKTSLFSHAVLDDGTVKVLCGTMNQDPETEKLYTFDGNDGEVATITISVDPSMELGNYSAIVTNAKLADADAVKTTISGSVESDITVSDVLVLDENSTVTPPTANDVNVTVRRTIKANEWSTICLPFDMTEEQVKAAFGDDVQLADFTSWESEEDDVTGDILNISIGFTDVTEIEANHPYIIKVSDAISEFTVDDVDIEVEDEPTVQVGVKKAERGYFIGTYVAQTTVPEDDLFLSGNKFWYSAGLTKMKAFRGYFDLYDVLTEVETSSAKVLMFVDDIATVIDGTGINNQGMVQGVYSIQGTFLGKEVDVNPLPDGLYIIDGKKVSIKK